MNDRVSLVAECGDTVQIPEKTSLYMCMLYFSMASSQAMARALFRAVQYVKYAYILFIDTLLFMVGRKALLENWKTNTITTYQFICISLDNRMYAYTLRAFDSTEAKLVLHCHV